MNAAMQIGDDKIQKQMQGYVRPEKFTHGSSKQREYWFLAGLKSGQIEPMMSLFEMDESELKTKVVP